MWSESRVAESSGRKEGREPRAGCLSGLFVSWSWAERGDPSSSPGGRSESPCTSSPTSFPQAGTTVQEPLGENDVFLPALVVFTKGWSKEDAGRNRMLLEFQFQSWRWICREQEGMVLAAQTEHLGCSRHLAGAVGSLSKYLPAHRLLWDGSRIPPRYPEQKPSLQGPASSPSLVSFIPALARTMHFCLLACLFCQPGGSWRSGPGVLSVSMSQAAGTQQVLRKQG